MAWTALFPVLGCGEDGGVQPPPQVPSAIAVSPATATLDAIGETVQLTATVRDQSGQVMTGVSVSWASSDVSVATVDGGLVTAAGNGVATVQASVAAATGTATVTVAQRPARLEVASGDNQSGFFDQRLPEPLVVRVTDPGGTAVSGILITFTPGEASGSVGPAEAATDTDGEASTEWTLGAAPTQSVAASAPGNLRAVFSAEASSGLYECGVGSAPLRVLDLPLRAIHASGNWGTNETVVREWSGAGPLVPPDHIAWLQSLHVNWVGISVAVFIEDSMDSTVERVYLDGGTFPDDAIRQFVRDLRAHGLNVYMTLAFEDHLSVNASRPVQRWQLGFPGDPSSDHFGDDPIPPEHWPWLPDHPDHDRFVSEFWETYTQQAVHFAKIAGEEGVELFSLGTETERLFRTRPWRDYFVNDFKDELQSMVSRVRAVYDGALTYDMHWSVLRSPDYYGPGSHCLWRDLNLDVIGVSAWFRLAESPPPSVASLTTIETAYDRVFREYLSPLASRNPERPVVLLEYGAMDVVAAAARPNDNSLQGTALVYADTNGNGVEDGRETQANIYRALFNTVDANPGVVHGAFLWDNWLASDELWSEWWANARNYDIRGKPAEAVVRSVYDAYRR